MGQIDGLQDAYDAEALCEGLDEGLFYLFFCLEPDVALGQALWLASEAAAAAAFAHEPPDRIAPGTKPHAYLEAAGRHLSECAQIVTGGDPVHGEVTREECALFTKACKNGPIERYRLLKDFENEQSVAVMVSHLFYLISLLLHDSDNHPVEHQRGYMQTAAAAVMVTIRTLCQLPAPILISRDHELSVMAAAYRPVAGRSILSNGADVSSDAWTPPASEQDADIDGQTYHVPLGTAEQYFGARWVDTHRTMLKAMEALPAIPSAEELFEAATSRVRTEEDLKRCIGQILASTAGGLSRNSLSGARRLSELAEEIHHNNLWSLVYRAAYACGEDKSLDTEISHLLIETLVCLYTYALVNMAGDTSHQEFVIPSFNKASCRRMSWEWANQEQVFFMVYRTFLLTIATLEMRAVLPCSLGLWAEEPTAETLGLLCALGSDSRAVTLRDSTLFKVREERARTLGERIVQVVPEGLLRSLYLKESDVDALLFVGALDEGWFMGYLDIGTGKFSSSLFVGSPDLGEDVTHEASDGLVTLVLGYYWDIVAPTEVRDANYSRRERTVTFRARDGKGRVAERKMPVVIYVPRSKVEDDYPRDQETGPRRHVRGYSVDGFTRRLPHGHRRSALAESRAADAGVPLPEGRTYVIGHSRAGASLDTARIYKCRSVSELLSALEESESRSPASTDEL